MSNFDNPQILHVSNSVLEGSKVLQRGSQEYEKENDSYLSAFENEVKPTYIVKPSNVRQVQSLVQNLYSHVLSGDCQVAVRGAGGTPVPGSANIQDGVTIDLRGLKGIKLNEDKSVVEIGYGLTTAGARTGRVGIGGFILGENADLWIALKGGLNNFGIVTSLKMKTFKSADIWGGVIFYMSGNMFDTFLQLLRNAYDFVHNEENPPSLQRFATLKDQVKGMGIMRTSTYLGFANELSNFSSDGKRQYWATPTIKPDVSLMEAFHRKWKDTLSAIQDAQGLTFSFGFHPLSKAMLENSAKADAPLFVVLVNPGWELPEDDTRIFTAVGDLIAELRHLATENGLLHRYIFPNYAYQTDDIIAGYGEESVRKLRGTSEKYDPEGFFQKGVPGGFKLQTKKA
ncbi:FAD-binding domain-containing protein [Whalleya microplaca]|nr:FAD-binding domain-containing protein [Whalleya microplaca]